MFAWKYLRVNQENIARWTKFKDDYLALQARLQTMPDELQYEVMVRIVSPNFMFM